MGEGVNGHGGRGGIKYHQCNLTFAGDNVGKNPGIIIKEQRAKARETVIKAESAGWKNDEILKEAREKYECTCGYYKDLLQAFMVEGYTAHRAEKHIGEWIDNDLIMVAYLKGYKLVGYGWF